MGGCLAEVQSYILVEIVETLVPDDEELGVTDGGGEGCLEGTVCDCSTS